MLRRCSHQPTSPTYLMDKRVQQVQLLGGNAVRASARCSPVGLEVVMGSPTLRWVSDVRISAIPVDLWLSREGLLFSEL